MALGPAPERTAEPPEFGEHQRQARAPPGGRDECVDRRGGKFRQQPVGADGCDGLLRITVELPQIGGRHHRERVKLPPQPEVDACPGSHRYP